MGASGAGTRVLSVEHDERGRPLTAVDTLGKREVRDRYADGARAAG